MSKSTYVLPDRFIKLFLALFVAFIALGLLFIPTLAAQADEQSLTTTPDTTPDSVLMKWVVQPPAASQSDMAFMQAISATKQDQTPTGGDADPGDTITYTILITNTSGTDALNVIFSDTIDSNTTLSGSLQVSPLAFNDVYTTVGNTVLQVGNVTTTSARCSYTSPISGNDYGFNGTNALLLDTNFTVAALPSSTDQLGTVIDNGNGSFHYIPKVGYTGLDHFSYTIQDSNSGLTATGEVTISISSMVWYINNMVGNGGTGTSGSPFNEIVDVSSEPLSATNHTIFIYEGDGGITGHGTQLNLLDGQQLIGEGSGLVLGGCNLVAAGNHPQVGGSTGHGVVLAQHNVIKGLHINNTTGGAALKGTSIDTATVRSVTIKGNGEVLDLNGGSPDMEFDSLSTTSADATAINLQNLGAASKITSASGTTLTGLAATDGIFIFNTASGASFDFGSTTITHGSGVGDGINLSSNNGASFTFDSLDVSTKNGTGLIANNSGTVNIGGTTNTISATGGAGLDVTNTSGGSWIFADVSADNGSNAVRGINLDTISNTVTINGGAIVNDLAAIAFRVNNGTSNITYNGTINETGGEMVDIQNRSGGTVTLGSTLACGTSCTGINLASNSGGTVAFSGTGANNTSINNTAGTGVILASNTGGTFTFSDIDIDNSTSNQKGFETTGSNTAATLSSSTGTLDSGTNTATDLDNIGLGMTLQSVSSAGGMVPGINLDTTTGSFSVSGDGSTSRNASGGTIQNKVGTSGVVLNSASNVSLSNMDINSNGTHGVQLTSVTGFTVTHNNVNDNGDAVSEHGINAVNLLGTVHLSNSIMARNSVDNIRVENTGAGIIDSFVVANSSFSHTIVGNALGNNGLNFALRGSGTMTYFDLSGSSFTNLKSTGIQLDTDTTATVVSATIRANTFTDNNIAINLTQNDTANYTFDIRDNKDINGHNSHAINIFSSPTATGGRFIGRITGNTLGTAGAGSGSTVGNGMRMMIEGVVSATMLVDSNTFANIPNGRGIEATARNSSALDLTLTNNDIRTNIATALSAIYLSGHNVTTGGTLRADVVNNTAQGGPFFFGVGGDFLINETAGGGVLEIVGIAGNCLTQITNTNTPLTPDVNEENAGCAIIAGPITVP